MVEKITSRFSLQAMKITWQIELFIFLIWLAVTGCAITSILSQPFTKKQRLFWIVIVLFVPLIGVLAYLPFSFNKEEVPDIFLMKHKKGPKRSAKGKSVRQN
jgi:phage terminase large subunit-like protein